MAPTFRNREFPPVPGDSNENGDGSSGDEDGDESDDEPAEPSETSSAGDVDMGEIDNVQQR